MIKDKDHRAFLVVGLNPREYLNATCSGKRFETKFLNFYRKNNITHFISFNLYMAE